MNNLPQSVTTRYLTNLLSSGLNSEFRLDKIECLPWMAEERICGFCYRVVIVQLNPEAMFVDVGTDPATALKNVLTKAGVTFR